MDSNVNHSGSDFEFKTNVAKMTDSYIDVFGGVEDNDEFDEYDAERSKIEDKIVSLKKPKNGSGLFSEMNLKDKQKLACEEAKLKVVMQYLGDLKTKQVEFEQINKGLLESI